MKTLVLAVAILLVGAFGAAGVLAEEKSYSFGDLGLPDNFYETMIDFRTILPNYDTFVESLPSAYDARDDGIVTDPKSQGGCGSCWSFTTVGAMEAHAKKIGYARPAREKAYASSPDWSEQQIIDCNSFGYDCKGGSMDAVQFYQSNGICTEADYPYTETDGNPCQTCKEQQKSPKATVLLSRDYYTVDADDDDAVKTSLTYHGPGYWRFDVHGCFMDYWETGLIGDVYVNTTNDPQGGHAMLMIGWDDSKNAWLLKNSWGGGGPNGDGTAWIQYSSGGPGPSSSSSSSSSGGSSGGGGCFVSETQAADPDNTHTNDLDFGMSNFKVEKGCSQSWSLCETGGACGGDQCCEPPYEFFCLDDCTCYNYHKIDCKKYVLCAQPVLSLF